MIHTSSFFSHQINQTIDVQHLLVEQFSLSNQMVKSGVTSADTNHIEWTLQCVFDCPQGSQTLSENAERDIAMVIVPLGIMSPCCCVCFDCVGGMFWNMMIASSSAMSMKINTEVY